MGILWSRFIVFIELMTKCSKNWKCISRKWSRGYELETQYLWLLELIFPIVKMINLVCGLSAGCYPR